MPGGDIGEFYARSLKDPGKCEICFHFWEALCRDAGMPLQRVLVGVSNVLPGSVSQINRTKVFSPSSALKRRKMMIIC